MHFRRHHPGLLHEWTLTDFRTDEHSFHAHTRRALLTMNPTALDRSSVRSLSPDHPDRQATSRPMAFASPGGIMPTGSPCPASAFGDIVRHLTPFLKSSAAAHVAR